MKKFTEPDSSAGDNKSGYYTVVRVVDGDTFELEDKIKVRLLGIDTPER